MSIGRSNLHDSTSSSIGTPFNLLDPLQLYATEPAHPVLGVLLHSGLQFGLVQTEIIHGTDTQNTHSRER